MMRLFKGLNFVLLSKKAEKGNVLLVLAHMKWHGGEVKRLERHQLSEDVDDVQVLSVHRVLLKLLHVAPVLQRHADLQPEKQHHHHSPAAENSHRPDVRL